MGGIEEPGEQGQRFFVKQRCYFEDFVLWEDKLWFSDNRYHALCTADRQTGRVEIVSKFPNPEKPSRLHSKVIRYGEKLVFIPGNAKSLSVYHRNTGRMQQIGLPDIYKGYIPSYKYIYQYFNGIPYQNRLFLISSCASKLVRLDMDTYEFRVFPIEKAREENTYRQACTRDAVTLGPMLFLPLLGTNRVLCFHMETEEYHQMAVGKRESRYAAIASDGSSLWMVDCGEGRIVRWRPGEKPEEVFKDAQLKAGDRAYFGSLFFCGRLILIKRFCDELLEYDVAEKRLFQIRAGSCREWQEKRFSDLLCESKYYFHRVYEGTFYLYFVAGGCMLTSRDGASFQRVELNYTQQDYEGLLLDRYQASPGIYEEKDKAAFSLFLEHLERPAKKTEEGREGSVGSRIHQRMKGCL